MRCAPYPGATIDTIYRYISMYDLTQFKSIIIYCGGNDSTKPDKMKSFKHGYDTLLKFIKNKNPDRMRGVSLQFLSKRVQRNDSCKYSYKKLGWNTWCHLHRCIFSIHYNNEPRTNFYKPRDWIQLSNSGTKRLLGTINLVISIVDNFKFCVFQQVSENKPEISNQRKGRQHRYQGGHVGEQQPRREPDTNVHNGASDHTTQTYREGCPSYGGQHRHVDPHTYNENAHYNYRGDSYWHENHDRNEQYGHHYDSNENYGQTHDGNS